MYTGYKILNMKRFALLIIFIPFFSFANEKPLPSRLKVLKHSSWYQDQAVFWKRQIDKNPEQPDYWFNYYFSLSYANSPSETRDRVARSVLEKWPDSFDSKLIAAKNYGFSETGLNFYRQVKASQPDHPEVLSMGLLKAEIEEDLQARRSIAKRLYELKLISPSLYNYAYNLLMSVEDGGVLFSESGNTSIPMLVLQDVLNIRKDVKIVNVNLLEESAYRSKIYNSLLVRPQNPYKGISSVITNLPVENPDISFYYSLTLKKDLIADISGKLNISGLALKYLKEGENSSGELARNTSRFLVDYLLTDFNNEGDGAAGRVLEPNYLPGFIILRSHYRQTNQPEQLAKINTLIYSVSDFAGITKKVENILTPKAVEKVVFPKMNLSTRDIDKQMVPIREPLFASNVEVTNAAYYKFLSYLRDNGFEEQHEIAKIDLSKFEGVALSSMKAYFQLSNNKKKGNGFNNYPVINISYEAAMLYCDWLTQQYNQQEKRKYKQVKFRLPTEKEWQIAALGYQDFQSWNLKENTVKADIKSKKSKNNWESEQYNLSEYTVKYPWYIHDFAFRNKITNQFDCYLANILDSACDCPATKYKGDGFTMTSPVATYFPNGMKLYDVIGNVAEMLDEKGKAAGGSWSHSPEASTISSISSYEGPDVKVGFRVFMEVIEE